MNVFVFLKYLFTGNYVNVQSRVNNLAGNSYLRNVKIYVAPGAKLIIGENVKMINTDICIEKGECIIGANCIIGDLKNRTKIVVNNGFINVDHHTKLSLDRIWVRFGGKMTIGKYTNINEGSEIRCDEAVVIGSYNQISYGVRIWDTNTHCILNKEERRHITEDKFPYFGYENSKPKTSPVNIGNDCWIGEKASILKGTQLGDEVIVGYNSLLSGQDIPSRSTVISKSVLDIRTRVK